MLLAGGYALAVVAAAVFALVGEDIGPLWRLTLFYEPETDAEPTLSQILAGVDSSAVSPKVPLLLAAGGLWAWALWQSLRGPVKGARPPAERGARLLRVALYAAAAFWMVYLVAPEWPWWASVLELLVTLGLVLAFHPVLRPVMGAASLVLFTGVAAHVVMIAEEVFSALGWRAARGTLDFSLYGGAAQLLWTILVIRAQSRDGRWRRATIRYGAAALIVPFALILIGIPLMAVLDLDDVTGEVIGGVAGALTMIWLVRSANDLADPGCRPVPAPVRLYPLAMTARAVVAARLGACALPLIPALANLGNGHVLWISPHVPIWHLTRRMGEVLPAIWWTAEAAAGVGGVTVLVLIAAHRGTRRTFRLAMGGLFLHAAAGFTVVVGVVALVWMRDGSLDNRTGLSGDIYGDIAFYSRGTETAPVSPLWFTAACLVSAALLWWAHTMRAEA
ncbi:hypothetical protein ACIBKY_03500 [Nonomuraea sp. NPDC050394]|uniref:hypothetical protein n=1 Tax=Nonomuraea sp. NPDC050394 TaxID=3364363 RepID=UPI0037A8D604